MTQNAQDAHGAQDGASAPVEQLPHEGVAIEPDVESLNFETALRGLEQAVAALESDRVSLDEALAVYAHGAQLAGRCRTLLADAELHLRKVDARGADAGPVPLDSAFDPNRRST